MHGSGIAIPILVLGCKTSIAVLLLAAGGAKLADLPGFASTVRLFIPAAAPSRASLGTACAIAAGELAAGAASLAAPAVSWLNLVVLAICCGFAVVAVIGYARYRGRPCRCFGALSGRGFGAFGVVRAAALAAVALAAIASVPSSSTRLSVTWQLLLLAGGALIAAAAFAAAAAAGPAAAGPATGPGWA